MSIKEKQRALAKELGIPMRYERTMALSMRISPATRTRMEALVMHLTEERGQLVSLTDIVEEAIQSLAEGYLGETAEGGTNTAKN